MPGRFTYSDSTTAIRSVVPEFDLLSPEDCPVLKLISGGDETNPSLSSLSEPCTAMKYEWMEDADPAMATTLAASASGAATSIAVATGFGKNLVEGHILLIGTEQLLVGVTDATDTIPVTRGFAGTTTATAASSAPVTIIGRVHKEGASAPADRSLYPTMPYNYVQEWTASIELTELEQAIKRYGIDNAVEYDTGRKMRDLMRLIERQVLRQDQRQVGSSTVPALAGGLKAFIPAANQVNLGAALVAKDVLDLMQTIYGTVGKSKLPDTIICGPWVRRKLTTTFATTSVTTFREQKDLRGGLKVDTIQTDFGQDLSIVLSDLIDPQDLFLVKREKLGFGPLQGKEFTRTMLAKTKTSDSWMVNGAYTFQVRASSCHGWIKNITLGS
jgi:hypothetical protein